MNLSLLHLKLWNISQMNKLLIVAAVSTMFASSAFAVSVIPAGVSASVGGGAGVANTISGSFNTFNGGSSESQAFNSQSSAVTSTAGISKSGVATTSGTIANSGSAYGWNLSTGTGIGSAISNGSADANVGENTAVNGGSSTGNEVLVSSNSIVAGKNQGGAVGSAEGGSFTASLSSTTDLGDVSKSTGSTSTTSVSSTLTGDAWGATATTQGSGLTVGGTNLSDPSTITVTANGGFNFGGAVTTGEGANGTLVNGN